MRCFSPSAYFSLLIILVKVHLGFLHQTIFFQRCVGSSRFFRLPVLECNLWLAPRYKLLIVDLVNDTRVTPEKEAKVFSSFLSASLL